MLHVTFRGKGCWRLKKQLRVHSSLWKITEYYLALVINLLSLCISPFTTASFITSDICCATCFILLLIITDPSFFLLNFIIYLNFHLHLITCFESSVIHASLSPFSRGWCFLLVLFRRRADQFLIRLHRQGHHPQQGPAWPTTLPARWKHTHTHTESHKIIS